MIKTSRHQQILFQAYLFNKGCSIVIHNVKTFLTNDAKEALKDLVNKKAVSYQREGKSEVFTALFSRKDVDFGTPLTPDEPELQVTSAECTYTPIFDEINVNIEK
jgi:hypothetical protein